MFVLNKKITIPDSFSDKNCCLVSYQMPLLKHCFVMCADKNKTSIVNSDDQLMVLFLAEAQRLALKYTGDANAYIYCFSGKSIRKRANFHIHVFIVQKRWQKAYVYSLLATKNWGQMLYEIQQSIASKKTAKN